MSVTRHARAVAAARQEARELAQREEYRAKLLLLQRAAEPPLSSAELSVGLGLAAPRAGETGVSEVARFLSDSPRFRKKRPDGATRALVDCLLQGELFLAWRAPLPGVRRDVLVCEERDLTHLASGWTVVNLGGRPVPARRGGHEWDDSALWDLFGPAAAPARGAAAAAPGGAEGTTGPDSRVARDAAPSADLLPAGDIPFPPLRLGELAPGRLGLGAMRLSTAGRPPEAEAVALLVAALEAGVRFIDTADSYCLDDSDTGHNETLIAQALAEWSGDRASVTVASKAGLRRPGGKWVPDGRPEHLRAACEASLRRLGGEALDLFLLHAPDVRVPFADSVGELGRLRAEGKIRHAGVSNVSREQLAAARLEIEVAAVENAVSFFDSGSLRGGLWQDCREGGILLVAHSPLGGHRDVGSSGGRAMRDPVLTEVAARRGLTVHQLALAWLLSWPGVLAIPGATRRSSLEASLAVRGRELAADELARLDLRAEARGRGREMLPPRFPRPPAPAAPIRIEPPAAGLPAGGEELVLFVGPPAAGKTSRVAPFLEAGYERLNRDLVGGRLDDLLPILRQKLAEGRRRFVLDNTYATREQRRPVLQIAREAGLPTRIVQLEVPVEEALYNACLRMLERHGRILDPEESKKLSRRDPNLVPPAAIYRFFEVFAPPHPDEGFTRLERIPFVRRFPPDYDQRALIVDIDGTIRAARGGGPYPRHPDEVELLPHRRETLLRYRDRGYLLLAVSNQAHIGLGQVSEAMAIACFDRLQELLGFPLEIHYCAHPPVPAGVWARKPMPGLGVLLIERHQLERAASIFTGDQEVDRQFAANCGFQFRRPEEIFTPVDTFP